MLKQWVKLAGLTAAATISGHAAFAAAAAERMVEGIGGEVLVFPLVMIIGGYLLGLFKIDIPVDYDDDMEDDF